MKTLIIEWRRLLDEQRQTCERCSSTEQEIEKAAHSLQQALDPSEIKIRVVKKVIDPEGFKKDVLQSNKILIADRTIEEWLGAETGQSYCCGPCGDSECRTIKLSEQTYETIPSDLIVRAGFLAASKVFNVKPSQLGHRKSALKVLPKNCCR